MVPKRFLNNGIKKGFTMMVLKQSFHNDGTKTVENGSTMMVPNWFHNDGTKTIVKLSTMMVLKKVLQ